MLIASLPIIGLPIGALCLVVLYFTHKAIYPLAIFLVAIPALAYPAGYSVALAVYAVSASFLGAWARQPGLVLIGRYATYLTALTLAAGTLALVSAFLDNQFNIRYVAEHSNLAMPRIYTWVAFYAGNEGSLLNRRFCSGKPGYDQGVCL